MANSQRLRLRELRAVSDLVGEIRELGADPTEWRTHALQGLIQLVGAQVGLTLDVEGAYPHNVPKPIDPLDVGFTDSDRRIYQDYYRNEVVDDPGATALFGRHLTTNFLTAVREQLVDDARWYSSRAVAELRRFSGIDDFVSTTITWNPGWMQGFIVYRSWGAARFGLRERRLLRLFHLSLLRLYKERQTQRSPDVLFEDLAPRLRQTLHLLLQGNSLKEIAATLGISVHTVNDYTKTLYQRLGVTSRAKLFSKYLSHLGQPVLALPAGMATPRWPTTVTQV